MKSLSRATGMLLTYAFRSYTPFLVPRYAYLMSTDSKTQAQKGKTLLSEPPQFEKDADRCRRIIHRNPNDWKAIYDLAVYIGHGATIYPRDLRGTKFEGMGLQKISVSIPELQAEYFRKVRKLNPNYSQAVFGLAQCLKKGVPAQPSDLADTWLQGGNWTVDGEQWGLTKEMTHLLASALEKYAEGFETQADTNRTNVIKAGK